MILALLILATGCEKPASSREQAPDSRANAEAQGTANTKASAETDNRDSASRADGRQENDPERVNARPSGSPPTPSKYEQLRERDLPDGESSVPAGSASKSAAPASPAVAPGGAQHSPRTFARLGADGPGATSCESDNDCTVSCYFDGSCCKELCGCSRVYNRTFAARLAQAVSQNCSPDVRCPVARCMGTKGGRAVCDQGQCTLARTESQSSTAPKDPSP